MSRTTHVFDWTGRRAAVLGGAGFLGSHLSDSLLDAGASVVCVDSFVTGTHENVAHLLLEPRFMLVRHDIIDRMVVPEPLDFVFNFASPASPVDFERWPIPLLETGAIGTQNALELAREHGAVYVQASTSEVYGDPLVNPQPEDYWGNVNPIGVRSVYDEGKRFGEALTMAYRRTHGLETRIARIFNTYGSRMRPDDGRAVPEFFRAALTGNPIPIHGDGSQTRSLCHVEDLIRGVRLLAESDVADPVNIGNPEEVTIKHLAESIKVLVGSSSQFDFQPRPADDPSVRCPDIARARDRLGWQPTVGLEEGLRRTEPWFRAKVLA